MRKPHRTTRPTEGLRGFSDLGLDIMGFQGGHVLLQGYGCGNCGKGFWVEQKSGLVGSCKCPHCHATALIP